MGTLNYGLFSNLASVQMLIHILKYNYGCIKDHTKAKDKTGHGHHVKGEAAQIHGKYSYKNCHRQRYAYDHCTPDTAEEYKEDTYYKTEALEHCSLEFGKGVADLGAVVSDDNQVYILWKVILELFDLLIKTVGNLDYVGTCSSLDRDIDTRLSVYRGNGGFILMPHVYFS